MTQTPQTDIESMKPRMRAMWMAGDFGKIALHSAKEAETFVSRLPIRSGMRVLDVACGTGNLAIPAARLGARVTGLDIAPNLLAQARVRADEEKLEITFDEGDAERLPYKDDEFDIVMTMFGAMFAPRPELVASELLRVCRSGGTLVMANWTPSGFVGKTFALMSRHAPPPPGIAPPVLWGDEATVRSRLSRGIADLKTTSRIMEFNYPFPPAQTVAFFREFFGPTQMAFARLDAPGQAALAADLEKFWEEHNRGPAGTTTVDAEYLEVIATVA